MKTRFRKALAVLLAVTLACCMSMPVFAAQYSQIPLDGKISITGTLQQLAGKEISVMPILDIESYEPAPMHPAGVTHVADLLDAYDNIEYQLNIAWLPFVVDYLLTQLGLDLDLDDQQVLALQQLMVELHALWGEGDLLTLNFDQLLNLEPETLIPELLGSVLGTVDDVLLLLKALIDTVLRGNILGAGSLLTNLFSGLDAVSSGLGLFLQDILTDPGSDQMVVFANQVVDWKEKTEADAVANPDAPETTILENLLGTVIEVTMPISTAITGGGAGTVTDGDPDYTANWSYNTTNQMVTVEFPGLDPAMYVVDFPDSIEIEAKLVIVPSFDAENIKLKDDEPTVDKTVSWETDDEFKSNNSANIGDEVTFRIGAFIPDWVGGYSEYFYKVQDTLSKGLTIDPEYEDNMTVELYYGPKPDLGAAAAATFVIDTDGTAPVNGYAVTFDNRIPDAQLLTIDFGNLLLNNQFINTTGTDGVRKAAITTAGGAYLLVTYTATLDEDAIPASEGGNANTAQALYSRDTTGGGYGKPSLPDTSSVYTYDIDIDKFDFQSRSKLNDAKFAISTLVDDTLVYDEGTDELTTTGDALLLTQLAGVPTYRLATGTEAVGVGTTTYVATTASSTKTINGVSVTAGGEAIIQGIREGTYYLHEVQTPIQSGSDRYAAPPGEFVINIAPTGGIYTVPPTYTVTSPYAGDPVLKSTSPVIPVGNGDYTASTGSVGTIGLTILGVVIIAGGVIFTTRSRKSRKTNQ